MQNIVKSQATAARRRIYFVAVQASDLQARMTGMVNTDFTGKISVNGAAASTDAGTFVEFDAGDNPGAYYYEFTSGEVGTEGIVFITITGTRSSDSEVMEPVEMAVQITSYDPYDATSLGLTAVNANTIQIRGVQPDNLINGKFASAGVVRTSTAQAGAAGSITLDASAGSGTNQYKGMLVEIVSGTGSGQARFIAAYNGSTKVATIDPSWVTNPDNTSVFVLHAGYLVIDASGHVNADMRAWAGTTTSTFAATFGLISDSSATGGGSNTITLSGGHSSIDDFYKNDLIFLYAGTGIGQSRYITAYNGTTKVATVDAAWSTQPISGTSLVILRDRSDMGNVPTVGTIADSVWDEARSGHNTAGTFGEGVVVNSIANGAVTAAAVATGAIDADALATDAASEIASAVDTTLSGTHGAGSWEGATAGAVADAVWDEARAGHVSAGSFGEYTNAHVVSLADAVITAAKFAADAITSTVLATSAAQEIRDAILNYSHDTGLTIKGAFRRLDAVLAGKATGLIGTVARYFMRDGTTEAVEATQDITLGTRQAGDVSGSEA